MYIKHIANIVFIISIYVRVNSVSVSVLYVVDKLFVLFILCVDIIYFTLSIFVCEYFAINYIKKLVAYSRAIFYDRFKIRFI